MILSVLSLAAQPVLAFLLPLSVFGDLLSGLDSDFIWLSFDGSDLGSDCVLFGRFCSDYVFWLADDWLRSWTGWFAFRIVWLVR